jgi:hypothetical protein
MIDIIGKLARVVLDKLFPDKKTKLFYEHEGKLVDLEREKVLLAFEQAIKESEAELESQVIGDIANARGMYIAEMEHFSGPLINFVRAIQRPYLSFIAGTGWGATIFFRIVVMIRTLKMIQFETVAEATQFLESIPKLLLIWSDLTIVLAVVGFWFGTRHVEKIKLRKDYEQQGERSSKPLAPWLGQSI